MKKGLTELVFILDKSGSMGGLEQDTIGGYNATLEKQKQVDGTCLITTVLFSSHYELLHDRTDIRGVSPLTQREYTVGGCTALLDAIGKTIEKIKAAQQHTAADYQAEKVIFVIVTDGDENSSHRYCSGQVKALIEQQKECGWEFLFLGANIDAVETAGKFGISPDRAQNFHSDSKGVQLSYQVMSKAVASFRACAAMPENWSQEIQDDFQSRKKR